MTDVLNVGINYPVAAEIICSPNEIQQFLPPQNVAFILEQSFEEEVFLGREFDLFVANENLHS